LFKLWNIFQLSGNEYLERLKFGLGVTAQSSTYFAGYANDPQTLASYNYRFNGPGYALIDLLASYQINKNLTLSLNVNNILDKTYYTTQGSTLGGNWYGEPRNFLVTLRGKF